MQWQEILSMEIFSMHQKVSGAGQTSDTAREDVEKLGAVRNSK